MYIKVKVTPGAGKETIAVLSDDLFRISVKVPAERNMANARVIEMLREYYGGKATHIRIVSGHHSGSKIFDVQMAKIQYKMREKCFAFY